MKEYIQENFDVETIITFLVVIVLLLAPLWLVSKLLLPLGTLPIVVGQVIHDLLKGLWSMIFGPPHRSVQVVRRKHHFKKRKSN